MVSKLNDNHGVIGMEYAEFLGRNHAQVDIDMALLSARLADRLKTDAEERFWHAAVVCLVQGAVYANKLGFTDINVTVLEDFLVTCVSNMRNERASQTVDMRKQINVSNVLTQFLNSMRTKHTLFTNKIHVAKGKPPTNSILVQRDTSKLDGIYVQVGLEDGLLASAPSSASGWRRAATPTTSSSRRWRRSSGCTRRWDAWAPGPITRPVPSTFYRSM